jgi:uncharacterized heparinase superfamily protein
MVADPGLHGYEGEMRDYCRSTRAHSTVEVDGENSSETYGSFRVGRRAHVTEAAFTVEGGRGTFSGRHDGYRHLGVSHRRTVEHAGVGQYRIEDALDARDEHRYESRVHLHPEAVTERAGEAILAHRAGRTLRIAPRGPVRTSLEEGWHCPTLGDRRRTQVVVLSATARSVRMGYDLIGTIRDGSRGGAP